MENWEVTEWVLVGVQIVVPQLAIFLIGGDMKKGEDRGIDNVVPPDGAFGVVWPILFILLGFALGFAYNVTDSVPRTIFVYAFLDIWLIAWVPVFNFWEDKKYSAWIIHLAVMGALFAYSEGPREACLLVTPLLAWLLFASKLNYTMALQGPKETKSGSRF